MKKEVIEKISTLITSAFGLVAALAWNQAISELFKEGGMLHLLAKYGIWSYAILVTILAILITVWVGRIADSLKGEK